MTRSRHGSSRRVKSSANGVAVFIFNAWPGSKNTLAAGDRRAFPPSVMVEIKALACELPSRRGLPLAHWSLSELRREAIDHGLVAHISGTTLWRWLSQDALRPWRHRCWIFPRDPAFAIKAGRIIDLYHRRWQNKPLGPHDYVLCADEKTSIQATTPMSTKPRRAPDHASKSGRFPPARHSVKSQAIADSAIGSQRRLLHHSATANEYCPSSSTVARQYLADILRHQKAVKVTRQVTATPFLDLRGE